MEELTKRIEALVARIEAERRVRDGHDSSDADTADDHLSQLRTVKQAHAWPAHAPPPRPTARGAATKAQPRGRANGAEGREGRR
eukprot:3997170-Prymnesium_polylepis.1